MHHKSIVCLSVLAAAAMTFQDAWPQTKTSRLIPFDSTTEIPCSGDRCDVNVRMTTDNGCTAFIDGYIHITSGKPKLVWTLNPTSISTDKYSFHLDYGILIITDDGNQLKQNMGGIGDGSSSAPTVFHWKKHDNKVKAGLVQYFPVVLKTDSAGVVSMCASQDPRIANDGP